MEVSYRPTDRNEPARAFLEHLATGKPVRNNAAVTLALPAATLAQLRYTPDERAPEPVAKTKGGASLGKSAQ